MGVLLVKEFFYFLKLKTLLYFFIIVYANLIREMQS